MNLSITKPWNGGVIIHRPVNISLDWKSGDDFLTVGYSSPFYGDPPAPTGAKGQPFPKLWDYEVVGIFLLGLDNKYVEVEVCPHGQHLVRLLDAPGRAIKVVIFNFDLCTILIL